MAEWLDRWAKRAANVDGADAQTQISSSAAAPKPSASRRDFLKKAGIVGGIAWSVPVMQTVMAPAARGVQHTSLGGNCAAASRLCATTAASAAYCNGCDRAAASVRMCPGGSRRSAAMRARQPVQPAATGGSAYTCGGPGAASVWQRKQLHLRQLLRQLGKASARWTANSRAHGSATHAALRQASTCAAARTAAEIRCCELLDRADDDSDVSARQRSTSSMHVVGISFFTQAALPRPMGARSSCMGRPESARPH